MRFRRSALAAAVVALVSIASAGIVLSSSGAAAEPLGPVPDDPLGSVMWAQMVERHLDGGRRPIVFDTAVVVEAPAVAEDQMQVPVSIDASALGAVERIVVLADLNPIAKILEYRPQGADAYIAVRIKVEQATPIRAAVLTTDGTWHVGGVLVDAAGGGCTSPALAHGQEDWRARLAEVQARIWRSAEGEPSRLRIRIRHPMDTGLASGIPRFHVEALDITTDTGEAIGRLDVFEPVSENPTVTVKPRLGPSVRHVIVRGRDTDGNEVGARIPAGTGPS